MESQIVASRAGAADGLPVRLALLGDERLARQVARGSDRAFVALYERYHQRIYRYCRSMVRNDADAQDVTQSTFAGALVALRRAERDVQLRPWLFRIAHNESVSLLRRRRPEDELPDALESSAASVEEAVAGRARLAQLVGDLHELPDRQRGALLMHELSGLRHEEIAQALGISVGVAKQTVFEARRSLAEFAEGRAMSCEEMRRTISDGDRRALRSRRMRAHLRDCRSCAAFAAAIPARRADLRALYPPISAVGASSMLARITGGGSGHTGGGGGMLTAATGKTAGAALSVKSVAAGVAVIATAAAGTAGAVHQLTAADGSRATTARSAQHDRGPQTAPEHAGTTASGAAAAVRSNSVGRSAGATAAARTAGSGSAGAATATAASPLSRSAAAGSVSSAPGAGLAPSPASGAHPTGASTRHRPGTTHGRPSSPGSSGSGPGRTGSTGRRDPQHPSGSTGANGTGGPSTPPNQAPTHAGTGATGSPGAGSAPQAGANPGAPAGSGTGGSASGAGSTSPAAGGGGSGAAGGETSGTGSGAAGPGSSGSGSHTAGSSHGS